MLAVPAPCQTWRLYLLGLSRCFAVDWRRPATPTFATSTMRVGLEAGRSVIWLCECYPTSLPKCRRLMHHRASSLCRPSLLLRFASILVSVSVVSHGSPCREISATTVSSAGNTNTAQGDLAVFLGSGARACVCVCVLVCVRACVSVRVLVCVCACCAMQCCLNGLVAGTHALLRGRCH